MKKDFGPGSLGLLNSLLNGLEAVPEFSELVGHFCESYVSKFSISYCFVGYGLGILG